MFRNPQSNDTRRCVGTYHILSCGHTIASISIRCSTVCRSPNWGHKTVAPYVCPACDEVKATSTFLVALEQIDAAWEELYHLKAEHAFATDMGAIWEAMEDEIYEKEGELRFLIPQDIYRRYLELGANGFKEEIAQREADRLEAQEAEASRLTEVTTTAFSLSVDLAPTRSPRSQMIHRNQMFHGRSIEEQTENLRVYLAERILEIQRDADECFSDLIRGFVLTTSPILLMDLEQLNAVGTALRALIGEIGPPWQQETSSPEAPSSPGEQLRQELDAAVLSSPASSSSDSASQQQEGFWDAAQVEAARQTAIGVIVDMAQHDQGVQVRVLLMERILGTRLSDMSAEEVQELRVILEESIAEGDNE